MVGISPDNRLNELTAKEWLPFTKTWFVHNPPRRKKNEVLHPAKYPEDMIEGFIKFFTKPKEIVFDPFLGTGSTLVAAHNCGRAGIGIELQEKYAKIANERMLELDNQQQLVILGDSLQIDKLWREHNLPEIDLVLTSPPYGPMLNKKGLVSKARQEKGLDIKYSEDENDLGNAANYEDFLQKLLRIFIEIKTKVKVGGHLVVVLQNYMNKGNYQMLAWDFAREMSKEFQFRGEKIWCQDNKTLYPYGYKYSFVPNVHHHYCLIFKKLQNSLTQQVSLEKRRDFEEEIRKKIAVEGWAKQGRNSQIKTQNFLRAWVTEYAFKEVLTSKKIKFSTRAQYIGDAAGAGFDFTVESHGKPVSVGLRSIGKDAVEKWKEVTYPDDRFRLEQDKIADYHVVCTEEKGLVTFLGVISKRELLEVMEKSVVGYSKKNQEKFRKIPLNKFKFSEMVKLLEKWDKF